MDELFFVVLIDVYDLSLLSDYRFIENDILRIAFYSRCNLYYVNIHRKSESSTKEHVSRIIMRKGKIGE